MTEKRVFRCEKCAKEVVIPRNVVAPENLYLCYSGKNCNSEYMKEVKRDGSE